jgi:hypothetical protein
MRAPRRSAPLVVVLMFMLAYVVVVLGWAVGAAAMAPPGFSSEPTLTGFGFHSFDETFGEPPQAGGHPVGIGIQFETNNTGEEPTGGEVREVSFNFPAGFVGDPNATAQCSRQLLDHEERGEAGCPAASRVGFVTARLGLATFTNIPLYNMVPPEGLPAQFALDLDRHDVFIDASVRTGGDYGITVHAVNNPPNDFISVQSTVSGELGSETEPFLTLPTACEGPQPLSAEMRSWEEPNQTARASFLLHNSAGEATGFTGCEHLAFRPSLSVAPDTSEADTPASLTVDVRMPQEGLSVPERLGESDIKATTVVLPEGVVINPGQAEGLEACQETAEQSAIGTEDAPSCPSASKVGEVEAETPLLKHNLKGDVYVLQSNPPELHLLLALSGSGVNVKLVGIVRLDEATGRLTTTFGEQPEVEATDLFLKGHLRLPELPVTDFRLSFNGGERAALATPTACGVYTTRSDFTPWSAPFVPDVSPSSGFQVASGPGGAPCPPSSLPFAPSLIAGPTTDQAGGYTDFSLLLQRADGQQRIAGLQFKAPEGLLGMIPHVQLCTNAQAEANECPAASMIGHTVVESGPGAYPLVVPEPGQPPAPIYLTEPYEGAPFGLAIVVPLHVGPFTLATQRVRARIEVDPRTAQLTVTTNPLPQMVAGVPTDVREIVAVVDHPSFMINPTDCNPSSFSGTAYGAPPPGAGGVAATAQISSRFQVGSCRSLKFTPKFTLTTSAKASRVNGADLDTTLTYPTESLGAGQATGQANIARVKIELPKQLPARLTTLRKACAAAVFEANPAGCPPASVVGHALVHTPVLPVPLSGPVYFVSHGGEAFPSLIVVLQGDNVTVDVEATTFISKKDVTSLTFKAAPDAPFSSFELDSPQGPYSALAANGSLCKGALEMPTEFVAQNGAEIHQNTRIAVTGCPGRAHRRERKRSHWAKPPRARTCRPRRPCPAGGSRR